MADWEGLARALGPQPAGYRGQPLSQQSMRDLGKPPGRVETYKEREARLLGQGLHPRTGLPLANNGETCGSCRHRVVSPFLAARDYWKCAKTRATWTGGRATDCLAKWPACSAWASRDEAGNTVRGPVAAAPAGEGGRDGMTSAPVLKYPGSKHALAAWIVAHMPAHQAYLEPCFGSGAVLFAKPRAPLETINDLDGRVGNLFRVLRDRAEDLARAVTLTPWSRAEYRAVGEAEPVGDDVEDARRFLVRCWQSHGSHLDRRNGWRCATGRSDQGRGGVRNYAGEWARLPEVLAAAAARLQGVQVECLPATMLIPRHAHAGCLIYCDPPYPRSMRRDAYYAHEMSDVDHAALLDALDTHPGPVLLSGYRCDLYDERLAHWRRVDKAAFAEGGRSRVESLWLNPEAVRRLASRQLALLPDGVAPAADRGGRHGP